MVSGNPRRRGGAAPTLSPRTRRDIRRRSAEDLERFQSRKPGAELLVRDAHRAATGIADETIAFVAELHPELLARLPPELDEVLRLAVRHASVRWLCGVADWWARSAHAAPGEDA